MPVEVGTLFFTEEEVFKLVITNAFFVLKMKESAQEQGTPQHGKGWHAEARGFGSRTLP